MKGCRSCSAPRRRRAKTLPGPLRNRVDPWGDLHAVAERGMFTGNRGCLVDENGNLRRHHRGSLWITCLTQYRDWSQPLAAPGRWTPVFFLDEAVALAAGHRPCGLCRREAYQTYRDGATAAVGSGSPLTAAELNRRLAAERLRRGRGLSRASDRITWTARPAGLPSGSVIVDDDGAARLVTADRVLAFSHRGWTDPLPRPSTGMVTVLTPQISVGALTHGFEPTLHPTAMGDVV